MAAMGGGNEGVVAEDVRAELVKVRAEVGCGEVAGVMEDGHTISPFLCHLLSLSIRGFDREGEGNQRLHGGQEALNFIVDF